MSARESWRGLFRPGGPDQPVRLSVETDPGASDVTKIERGLFSFEEARLGPPGHEQFGIFLRDAGGDSQGGIDCHVMWHRLFVKTLWVPAGLRGQGWGTKLMRAAEIEGQRRDCKSIWLTALGARACHFYQRLDYRIFGVYEDYVGSEALYSLAKELLPR